MPTLTPAPIEIVPLVCSELLACSVLLEATDASGLVPAVTS